MAYRATLDASHKVTTKGGHHVKFMRHIARDVDRAAGVVHPMANENIDWARTQHNRTMVYDGKGGFRPAQTSEELVTALEERMAAVKDQKMPNGSWRAGMRSNSVVLRPFVLSLPKEWYDEHSPDWERGEYSPEAERLHNVVESWIIGEVAKLDGVHNIPGYSWHMDESLPAQLQLAFTPVTSDGRLNQGAFFTGPKQLKDLHIAFRQHLKHNGFDIEMSSSERSRERLGMNEFQQRADKLRDDQYKLDALLAVAKDDGDKLWEERKQVRAEKGALEADRAQLDHEKSDWAAELPKLRAKAKSDGYTEGRDQAEHETADARFAAVQAQLDAETARDAAQTQSARLQALAEDIKSDLAEAGQMPQMPSYDDMRNDILGEQSAVMTKYLKQMRRKDGTTMFDDFERYAREEHMKAKGKLGWSPDYDLWRDRTVEARGKIVRAHAQGLMDKPRNSWLDRDPELELGL